MKILFIAYYFEPFKGVGAKRISYWAQCLSGMSKNDISLSIVTATKPDIETINKYEEIIYVKDNEHSIFKYFFKYDRGITWFNDLKNYFKKINFDYDIVLITGSPFLHFGIGPYLKKRYNTKVILDFRDPFAINPLFKNQNVLKRIIKKNLEKYFLKYSDKIIVVNEYCATLLVGEKSGKIEIIDNGYDERIINKLDIRKIKPTNQINIVYAGKLSHGRNIDNFISFINKNTNYHFHYIGEDYDLLKDTNNTTIYGQKSYFDTMKIISNCDIGLVLTGGNAFESTTKIFDYIGLQKTILILTNGKKNYGNIHRILKNYPCKIWCYNDVKCGDCIERGYKGECLDKDNKIDIMQYSRNNGLKKLLKILNELK